MATDKKKKYTKEEVEKIINKLCNGKNYSYLETIEIENIDDKISNEIYPNSNKEAKEYLSDEMAKIADVLYNRADW